MPAGYTGDAPAPLIILLHTYGRTGAVQDEYMGLSALANAYGFLSVAPDGTPSAAENNPRFWNASAACCNWEGKELDDSAYIMCCRSTATPTAPSRMRAASTCPSCPSTSRG